MTKHIKTAGTTTVQDAPGGSLRISLVKGLARLKPRHVATVQSLGLRRIGQEVIQPNNPAIQGMIKSVGFLIKVQAA
jgi:large subunit ribosomal protein L30